MRDLPTLICALLCCLFVLIFIFLLLKGNKKYEPYVSALDQKEYGLRNFMPVGFAAMDLIGYQYSSKLDAQVRRKLKELRPPDYTEFYLRVFWASAVTYVLIGLCMASLFGVAMGGSLFVLGAGVGLAAVLAYSCYSDIENKIKERHTQISIDMTDLTNKILILSGAGLTLRAAIIKTAEEAGSDRTLYQELGHSVTMMKNGATDESALDYLILRCNMPEMRRFVSVILQNMHRGGQDVLVALREIGQEQWDNRKATAKRIAEEAGTKMLFPMMIMLFAVIMMVIVPAVMSISF